MANLNAPFGLNPVGSISGGANQKLNEYKIASNETNAIFQGDMVQPDSGNIQQAGTGTTNIGVFWGCKFDDATTNKPNFKNQSVAGGNGAVADAFVYDDPHQVFEVQGDGASAQTDVMQTADVVVGTGSTATGVSGMTLDSAGPAGIGAGANLMIIGFSNKEGRSEIGSDNAVYNVLINEHLYA